MHTYFPRLLVVAALVPAGLEPQAPNTPASRAPHTPTTLTGYVSATPELTSTHARGGEDSAAKVERQMRKSAVPLLASRVAERFNAVVTGVTGASAKGTWIRISIPPVEGRPVGRGSGSTLGMSSASSSPRTSNGGSSTSSW